MMRVALGVAALIGASSACSFLPCDKGCTPSWPTTDESTTVSGKCLFVGQIIDLVLPPVNSCHVNVATKLQTPDVCVLGFPNPTPLARGPAFTARVKCGARGVCTVNRHMELQRQECTCPWATCEQDSDCEATHTCRSRLLEAAVFPERGTCSTAKVCTRKSVVGEPCGGLVQDCETNVCDGALSCTFNGHLPGQCFEA